SRICVKDLPKQVTNERLRDFFSQKGEVTDVKVMRTEEGRSRLAFIGFRTEHEAQEAIKYFNKNYLDTSRIVVEIAHKPGDENAPRPRSRHSLKREVKFKKIGEKIKKEPESAVPSLQEFLDVVQWGKKKMWSNDMSIAPTVQVTSKEKVLVKKADEPMVSNGAERNKAKRSSDTTEKAKKKKVVAPSDDVSDMEYFKSRRTKKNLSYSDSDSDEQHDADNLADDADGHDADVRVFPIDGDGELDKVYDDDAMEVEADGKMAQESKADSDDVLVTGRLFVHNLAYQATEEELMEHFSKFGEISEVHLVIDKETKRATGTAFILYLIPESAARAMEGFDNSFFQGRVLRVSPAKHRETSHRQVNHDVPKTTFKQKREEERKASEAGGNTKAWNSLFMRSDTVVENMVRMYGVSKSELLDRECEDPAVRLALAETKVIAETKEALAKAGVNVTSLEAFATGKGDDKKRSKHILLVKNLPFASTEKELAQMFGKYARLDKIILPPTKTMALVVCLEAAEAREAYKRMAGKRYKDAPLYLEWAPEDILEPKPLAPDTNENNSDDVGENHVRRVNLEQLVNIDTDITESSVVYVKNLNFKTSEESLEKHLTQVVKQGKILSVKIIKHEKNGKMVSKGYGFVEFDSNDTATTAIRDAHRTVLDSHALILTFSEDKRSDTVRKKGSEKDKQTCTKLIVNNVPFETTPKELRGLFSQFGQIKGLRLPRRNTKQIKGFAFVEFVTKQEASNAFKALSNIHFYGRHLVLGWANDDNDSMKALRDRSGAKYMDQENDKPKKRKSSAGFDESRTTFVRRA
ncbi:unnamed protein product, partial [Thlaspi arvense]